MGATSEGLLAVLPAVLAAVSISAASANASESWQPQVMSQPASWPSSAAMFASQQIHNVLLQQDLYLTVDSALPDLVVAGMVEEPAHLLLLRSIFGLPISNLILKFCSSLFCHPLILPRFGLLPRLLKSFLPLLNQASALLPCPSSQSHSCHVAC